MGSTKRLESDCKRPVSDVELLDDLFLSGPNIRSGTLRKPTKDTTMMLNERLVLQYMYRNRVCLQRFRASFPWAGLKEVNRCCADPASADGYDLGGAHARPF